MTLRRVVALGLAIGALTLAACGDDGDRSASTGDGGSIAGATVRWGTFGGTWQDWITKVVLPRFDGGANGKLELIGATPQQHLAKVLASQGQDPPVDLVDVSDDVMAQAAQHGSFEYRVTAREVPNLAKLPAPLRPNERQGVALFVAPGGIVYDVDKFKSNGIPAPTTWQDLADPKLAGHVAIPDISFASNYLYAAINQATAGDQTKLAGSLGLIDRMKDPAIYQDFPSLQTQFQGGDIWAVVGTSGYLTRLSSADRNLKFALPQTTSTQRGTLGTDRFVMPKGAKNRALALKVIDTLLSTPVQLQMATATGFVPSNSDAVKQGLEDPKLAPVLVKPQEIEQLFQPDYERLTELSAQWLEEWNRAIRK